jgi:hypothetical protein
MTPDELIRQIAALPKEDEPYHRRPKHWDSAEALATLEELIGAARAIQYPPRKQAPHRGKATRRSRLFDRPMTIDVTCRGAEHTVTWAGRGLYFSHHRAQDLRFALALEDRCECGEVLRAFETGVFVFDGPGEAFEPLYNDTRLAKQLHHRGKGLRAPEAWLASQRKGWERIGALRMAVHVEACRREGLTVLGLCQVSRFRTPGVLPYHLTLQQRLGGTASDHLASVAVYQNGTWHIDPGQLLRFAQRYPRQVPHLWSDDNRSCRVCGWRDHGEGIDRHANSQEHVTALRTAVWRALGPRLRSTNPHVPLTRPDRTPLPTPPSPEKPDSSAPEHPRAVPATAFAPHGPPDTPYSTGDFPPGWREYRGGPRGGSAGL